MNAITTKFSLSLSSLTVMVVLIVAIFSSGGIASGSEGFVPFDTDLDGAIRLVVHVNPSHPQASDSNPGTAELPLRTIERGRRIAVDENKRNIGVKVLIYPGVYRESMNLWGDNGRTDAPIIFEAVEPGTAIISGSDVWSDWQQGSNGVYTHHWPYRWGYATVPPTWNLEIEPIVRRHEMIFVNGERLEQVLSQSDLTPGRFFVSEGQQRVYLIPPSGVNMSTATVEVATRSRIFVVNGRNNVAIRGLVIQHDNDSLELGTGTQIANGTNIVIENTTFRYNNWTGIGLSNLTNVILRNNRYVYNGGTGLNTYRIHNILSEGEEASYNNWRGVMGGYTGWSVAGSKNLHIHGGTWRNFTAVGNYTRGFWFDSDVIDVVVERARWCDNLSNGLFIESNPGPVTIRDSVICNNQSYGILSANTEHITLDSNVICGNGSSQIHITGNGNGRTHWNWVTGETEILQAGEHWAMNNNTFVGLDASQRLLSTTLNLAPWNTFVYSLNSDHNVWFNHETDRVINGYGNGMITLDEWRSSTQRDLNSVTSGESVDCTSFVEETPVEPPSEYQCVALEAGSGLRGDYYGDATFSNLLVSRVDQRIDFNWDGGSPAPEVGTDGFFVRWTGWIVPTCTQQYTFSTFSDDGVRLWINDQLVIDDWNNHSATLNSGQTGEMIAGERYPIRIEYYEAIGAAEMRLMWSGPAFNEQIVPHTQLYPADEIVMEPTATFTPEQPSIEPTPTNTPIPATPTYTPEPPTVTPVPATNTPVPQNPAPPAPPAAPANPAPSYNPAQIRLTGMCPRGQFQVYNGNTMALNFTYSISGGANGNGSVPANGAVAFNTGAPNADVHLYVNGVHVTSAPTIGNCPPVAVDDTANTNANTPVIIPVLGNDSDPDGNPLTIVSSTPPSNGSVNVNGDGTITYTPANGFVGNTSFVYTISDNANPVGIQTATVHVTVNAVNPPSGGNNGGGNGGGGNNGGGNNGGNPAPQPTVCNPNPSRDLNHEQTYLVWPYHQAQIVNRSNVCSYQIGLASYEKYDEVVDNQVPHDWTTVTIGPGQTLTLQVDLPDCAAQIDLFYGAFIPDLSVDRYQERLLDWKHVGETNYCGQGAAQQAPPPADDGETPQDPPADDGQGGEQPQDPPADGGQGGGEPQDPPAETTEEPPADGG